MPWVVALRRGGEDEAVRRFEAGIDDYGVEETIELLHEIASARKRLFAILGWTVAGLVAVGAGGGILSLVYMPLAGGGPLTYPGVAGISVLAGFGGVFLVKGGTPATLQNERGARWLFSLTCASYAVLVNVFGGGLLRLAAEASFIPWTLPWATASVVGVLGAIAIGIGYRRSKLRTTIRWCVLGGLFAVMGLAAGTAMGLPLQGLVAGIVVGLVICWCTDVAMEFAIESQGVPSPAIAACLVAAMSAIAIWLTWLVVRFMGRVVVILMPFVMGFINFVFDMAEALLGYGPKR